MIAHDQPDLALTEIVAQFRSTAAGLMRVSELAVERPQQLAGRHTEELLHI